MRSLPSFLLPSQGLIFLSFRDDRWLDASAEATKEEYEEHQKELEAVANPIMQKAYGAGGMPQAPPAGGASGGFPGAGGDDGPSVEEVD